MGLSGRTNTKSLSADREQTYEQKMASFKETLYQVANAHLIENQHNSPLLYYFCLFLQNFALLCYVLHPGLNIFGKVYLLEQLRTAFKFLNFHQHLQKDSRLYVTFTGIILAYLCCQVILICISCYCIMGKSRGEFAKYLKKIVNFQFIFNVKVASGPILALAVNVFYCQQASPYRVQDVCYSPIHIVSCALTAVIVLLILGQILVFGTFYFIKNPLTTSYMGDYTRYFTLSKAVIKIMLPVYFAVDYTLSLSIVYLFLVTALLGAYLGWHRLFSVHSYQQEHFYVEYFMESVLFWMAVNNILSYYIEGPSVTQPMSLVYGFFSAVLVAVLLMNIEKKAENQFIRDCLQRKVKKQSMERFVFILINLFLHESSKEARLTFKVYSKIISKNIQRFKEIEERLCEVEDKSQKLEVYRFMYILIESYLQENNSVILKTLKCYLLCYLGQKSYGLHQSLQLQEQRLGIAEEFMLYQLKINQNVFGNQRVQKLSVDFVKYYRFHQELGELQELFQLCAQNNLQYWEQLCEGDPSIAKLRNLATFYSQYEAKIAQQYSKVIAVLPQNLYSTSLYLKFLMSVGVDTKEALKIKQKMITIMEARSRSVRVSEFQFSEDEDLAIITVDSIGNNLGVVLNCNNNIQVALGYEKNGLLGKNVTKIMPKIYSELHNNFMLSFIRTETSHLRPFDKIVTALNKDSLLVEIKLTVRMMTSTQSALAIVGFIKPLLKEKSDDSGLLMFSLNSSEILGIDAQVQKLMNYKLSGKQLVQEEIKLASIMPELNLQLLQKERQVKTVLQVGSANQQEEIDIEITKPVSIQLKSTKLYEGINIGFLTISLVKEKPQNFNDISLSKTLSNQQIIKTFTPDLANMFGIQKQMSQDETSINALIPEKPVVVEDGLARELPMAKKMEQFLKTKQNTKVSYVIHFIHILTTLGCAALIGYIYLSHYASEEHMKAMYGQMRTVTDMPYYVSRLNLLTNLVWSHQKMQTQPDFITWLPPLNADFSAIKSTFNSLVRITNQYDLNLEYNRLNNYTFWYCLSINGTFLSSSITSNSINLFNNYFDSAGQFLYTNLTDSFGSVFLQIQSSFIRDNADQIIPEITDKAVDLYKGFFNSVIDEEFRRMTFLNIVVLAASAVIILLISFMANHIDRINQEVVEVYKLVRLWDVAELSNKCSDFLTAKGCKVTKHKNSSLLRIFPVRTFLQIIADAGKGKEKEKEKEEEKEEKSPLEQLSSMVGPRLRNEASFRDAMSPDLLLTPAIFLPAEHASSPPAQSDNEQALLKGTEVEPTVQMYWQSNKRGIIIGTILILLVIGGAVALSITATHDTRNDLTVRIQMLQDVGKVRKIVNFISYLSFRTIQNPSDAATRALLNKYIKQFYQYTAQTQSHLGHPVLKNTYTFVQTIQQWLALPNISNTNILLANFPAVYQGLKNGSDAIDLLNRSEYGPHFSSSIDADQQTQLVFSVTIFLMICLFVLALDRLYLRPIYRQSKHSLSMVKILPAWVFQRNARALELLNK